MLLSITWVRGKMVSMCTLNPVKMLEGLLSDPDQSILGILFALSTDSVLVLPYDLLNVKVITPIFQTISSRAKLNISGQPGVFVAAFEFVPLFLTHAGGGVLLTEVSISESFQESSDALFCFDSKLIFCEVILLFCKKCEKEEHEKKFVDL